MPTYSIIKMCHLTPLHIGLGREDLDTSASELHSDTISAALASIGMSSGLVKDAKDFLNSVKISSAFPFWKDTLFLPKPQGRLEMSIRGQEEHMFRKRAKSIKYIDTAMWSDLSSGKALTIDEKQTQGGFLLAPGRQVGTICESQISQRVSVPRDNGEDTSPFFFDWHYYDESAGLYCIVDADEETMSLVERLFRLLGEAGIGTDKSIGGGKFDVSSGRIELNEPEDANANLLLSLYVPTEDEFHGLLDGNPRYSLLLRGGYMAGSSIPRFQHLRKKSIYAFSEGSVFFTTKELTGKIADLRPDWDDPKMHPVYRSGLAFSIKIKDTRK